MLIPNITRTFHPRWQAIRNLSTNLAQRCRAATQDLASLLAFHFQHFYGDAQRSCGVDAVLKDLDFQRRMIGHDSVEFNKLDRFWMGNVKNRLYRFAPGICKAAVKSDVKNIVKCKMESLKFREVGKAIERLTRPSFVSHKIHKNFVYR